MRAGSVESLDTRIRPMQLPEIEILTGGG